jgi:hypothetical protein
MHTVTLPVSLGAPELRAATAPLWTVARGPYLVRCELRPLQRTWELCAFIDDQVLLSRQCVTQGQAGTVSADWRACLTASGWSPLGDWPTLAPRTRAAASESRVDRRPSDSRRRD